MFSTLYIIQTISCIWSFQRSSIFHQQYTLFDRPQNHIIWITDKIHRVYYIIQCVHNAQQSSMKSIGSLDLEEVYRRIVDIVVDFCATIDISCEVVM